MLRAGLVARHTRLTFRVNPCQLPSEDFERFSVSDDVVNGKYEQGLITAERNNRRTHRHIRVEIEGLASVPLLRTRLLHQDSTARATHPARVCVAQNHLLRLFTVCHNAGAQAVCRSSN